MPSGAKKKKGAKRKGKKIRANKDLPTNSQGDDRRNEDDQTSQNAEEREIGYLSSHTLEEHEAKNDSFRSDGSYRPMDGLENGTKARTDDLPYDSEDVRVESVKEINGSLGKCSEGESPSIEIAAAGGELESQSMVDSFLKQNTGGSDKESENNERIRDNEENTGGSAKEFENNERIRGNEMGLAPLPMRSSSWKCCCGLFELLGGSNRL